MPTSMPLDPAVDFELFARLVLDGVAAGNGMLLAALALLGLVAAVRFVFADSLPFLKTDLGAALLTFALGFAGAVVTALASGGALGGPLLLSALKVTLGAMGGFSALKKLVLPALAAAGVKPKPGSDPKPAGVEGVVGKIEEVP
jgi:hypothetical protein